ncbi:hypothetical protein ACHAQH_005940 [Verticillium albo-atrum]
MEEEDDQAAPNPWLRRLGAAAHLKDFSSKRDLLRSLIDTRYNTTDDPDENDDEGLQHIHAAFDRLVKRATAVAVAETVSWNALFEVNRKDVHKERSRPFHFRHNQTDHPEEIHRCEPAAIVRTAYNEMMNIADEVTDLWKSTTCDPEAPATMTLLAALESSVLEMIISILDHETKDTEYESILVSFLMVLSIRADHGWESFSNFTPKLSAIVAVSRLLLVKAAVDERAKSIAKRIAQGQSREKAEEGSPSHFDLLSDMTRPIMVGPAAMTRPMQFIFRLRNFSMAAHNNTPAQGSISWDKEEVVFKGMRISVLDIQGMLQSSLKRAETLLYRDLLLCTHYDEQSPAELGLPPIPWDELTDNAADATVGVSLADALFRHDGEKTKGWLFRKIWEDPALRADWFEPRCEGSRVLMKLKRAYRYGKSVDKKLEEDQALVHESAGQAARAPELLTLRHRNTVNGGIRNMVFDRGGMLMLIFGYHKGFTRTERLKVIHRFLPREVTTVIIYFLWLVLPFWEDVQANVWGVQGFPATLWGMPKETDELVDVAESGEATSARMTRLGAGPHWTSLSGKRDSRLTYFYHTSETFPGPASNQDISYCSASSELHCGHTLFLLQVLNALPHTRLLRCLGHILLRRRFDYPALVSLRKTDILKSLFDVETEETSLVVILSLPLDKKRRCLLSLGRDAN